MAIKKKENKTIIILFTVSVLMHASLISAVNFDCKGKAFYCLNSTHFMICVDLGDGISTTVDDFLIPCPPPTVCMASNFYECEYHTTSTTELPTSQQIILEKQKDIIEDKGTFSSISEGAEISTIIPFWYNRNVGKSEQYYNTENIVSENYQNGDMTLPTVEYLIKYDSKNYLASDSTIVQNLGAMGEFDLTTTQPPDNTLLTVRSDTLENTKGDFSFTTSHNEDYFDTVSTTTLAENSSKGTKLDNFLTDIRDTMTTSVTTPLNSDIISSTIFTNDIYLTDVKLPDEPIYTTPTIDAVTTNAPTSGVIPTEPTTEVYNLRRNIEETNKIIATSSGNEDYFVIKSTTKQTYNTMSGLPITTDSDKSFDPIFGASEDPGTENYNLLTDSKGFPQVNNLITTMSNYKYLSPVTAANSPKQSDVTRSTVPELYNTQEEIIAKDFTTASGLPQESITEGYSLITDFSKLEKNIVIPTSILSFDEKYATERVKVAKDTESQDSSIAPSYVTIEVDTSIFPMTAKEPITEKYNLFAEEIVDTNAIITTSQNYEEYFNIDSARSLAENPMTHKSKPHKPITKSYNIFTTTNNIVNTNNVIDTLNQNKERYFDNVTTATSTEQYNSNITNLSNLNNELGHITLLTNKSIQDLDNINISSPDVSTKTIPKSDNSFMNTNSLTNTIEYLSEYYYGNDDTVTKSNDSMLKDVLESDIATVTDDPKFSTKIPWPLSIQENKIKFNNQKGEAVQNENIREDKYTHITTSMPDIAHKVNNLEENTYSSGPESDIVYESILQTQYNIHSQYMTVPSERVDFITNAYTELYEPLLKENTIQDPSTGFSKLQITDNLNTETSTQRYPLPSTLKQVSTTQSDYKINTYYGDDNVLKTPTLDPSPKSIDTKTVYNINNTPENNKILNSEDRSKPALMEALAVPKNKQSSTYYAESSTINLQPVYDTPYIPLALEITKTPLTNFASKIPSLMASEQSADVPSDEISTKLLLNATTEVHFHKVTTENNPLVERYESISNLELTTTNQLTDFSIKPISKVKRNNDVSTSTSKSETVINTMTKIKYNYITSTDIAEKVSNEPIESFRTRPVNKNVGLTTHPLFNIPTDDVSTVTNMDRSEVISNIESTVFTNFNLNSDIKNLDNILTTKSLYFHTFDVTSTPSIKHEKDFERIQLKQYESQIETTIEKRVPTVTEGTLRKKSNITVKSSKEPWNSTVAVERNVAIEFPEKLKLNANITSKVPIRPSLEIHKYITFEQGPNNNANILLTRNTTHTTKYEENNNNIPTFIESPHKTTLNQSSSNISFTTLAPLNHSHGFNCSNRIRGKYLDEHNCKKFYICIGKFYPIIGECPINTVFSDILKQCTRNLSHCVRRNQFQCTSAGRFSDVFATDVYYICARNKNKYVRFKLRCQKGYILSKDSVTCIEDTSLLVSSSKCDSISKGSSSSSVDSRSVNNQETPSKIEFECVQEGTFSDPYDCKSYYRCIKTNKSQFRRRKKKCDFDEVFHKRKKKCVDAESYEC